MSVIDWTSLAVPELLRNYSLLMTELRRRDVLRTSNNPVADLTERIVCKSLGLVQQNNSAAAFDAVGNDGRTYQIKGRRITPENPSTQLSAIRRLGERPFDYLVGVVYDADFSIAYAAVVPVDVVLERARYSKHVNAHIFQMKKALLEDPRVKEITSQLVLA